MAWVETMLRHWKGSQVEGEHQLRKLVTVFGPPTRELLQDLVAEPIDVLVLVDHVPFADCSLPVDIPPSLPPAEIVREQAQRAILTLELARHATRTLALADDDLTIGLVNLAALLGQGADFTGAPNHEPVGVCAPNDLPLVLTYLLPLFVGAGNPKPLSLVWPRQCFLDGDAPGAVLPATVEVAGRARILVYGPYLPLPVGHWRVRACLGFSSDIGKMPFIFEVDCGNTVSRGFFEVERGGIYTCDFDFEVADAMHPVELRLISQESALEGQVALIEVALNELPALAQI